VKELLKSVHIYPSYKNNAAPFYGPRCMMIIIIKLRAFANVWSATMTSNFINSKMHFNVHAIQKILITLHIVQPFVLELHPDGRSRIQLNNTSQVKSSQVK